MPEIEVLTLLVQEPTTLLTDLMLAATGLCFAWSIRDATGGFPPGAWWTGFFALISLSTLSGGIAHGFGYAIGNAGRGVSWLSAGLAVFCAEEASIRYVERSRTRVVLRTIAWIELAAFVVALLTLKTFMVVTINTATGLLGVVATIHIHRYRTTGAPGSRSIVAGILVAGLTAVIHGLKLSPSPWYNHNDLSHTILLLSLYLIMRGVRNTAHEMGVRAVVRAPGIGTQIPRGVA